MEGDFNMLMKIVGLIIGTMIAGTSIYYYVQDKDDASSRRIYGTAAIVGAVIAVIAAVMLLI